MDGGEAAATSNTERWQSQLFRTPQVLAVTVLVIAVLAVIDAFLVRADHAERIAAAAAAFERAERLTHANNHEGALELYRTARNIRRDDERYQLALVQALRQTGRLEEAEREARRLLQEHPAHGPGNLILARTLAEQGDFEEAEWFYHRSIYGSWSEAQQQQRRAVRFELADLLASRGQQEELIAEVLVLMGEQEGDLATKRRAADLLLQAGAGARSAELYRELLRERARDAELYGLYGLALLSDHQYRRGRANLETALALGSEDPRFEERAQFARDVVTMDPFARGLSSRERARRARLLVEKTSALLEACTQQQANAEILARVKEQLASNRRRITDELIENDLAMTEQAWEALPQPCRTGTEAEAIGAILDQFQR
jgi:predicted Zn-dependent protease